jgi:hypothetical protein
VEAQPAIAIASTIASEIAGTRAETNGVGRIASRRNDRRAPCVPLRATELT